MVDMMVNNMSTPSNDPFATEQAQIPLTPEEIQAKLQRNALSLSEENQIAYSQLIRQDWFADVRALAAKSSSVNEWVQAIDRIASGTSAPKDIKTAVFYRSAWRAAGEQAGAAWADRINTSLLQLTKYMTTSLKPQHNHFG